MPRKYERTCKNCVKANVKDEWGHRLIMDNVGSTDVMVVESTTLSNFFLRDDRRNTPCVPSFVRSAGDSTPFRGNLMRASCHRFVKNGHANIDVERRRYCSLSAYWLNATLAQWTDLRYLVSVIIERACDCSFSKNN